VDGELERDLGGRDEEGIGVYRGRWRRGVPWGRSRLWGFRGRQPAREGAKGSAHRDRWGGKLGLAECGGVEGDFFDHFLSLL
jgi:hypothetical protein